MSQPVPSSRNRLLIPLLGASLLCVIEAVVIAFLLGRGHANPSAPTAPTAPDAAIAPAEANATPPPAPPAQSAPPIARGKVGQRVDAGGVAMTVLTVSNEPRFKEVFAPSPSQKFLDVEVLIENNTPRGFAYYPNQFTVKDDKARPYSSTALGAGEPALTWATLAPGEKARGHLAFVLPRDATGLTLTYPVSDASAIHIELGQ